ncbi:MAG: site-specific integrase [Tagaea sp.]|nr:site-specific integrase [Tagaea sp.]
MLKHASSQNQPVTITAGAIKITAKANSPHKSAMVVGGLKISARPSAAPSGAGNSPVPVKAKPPPNKTVGKSVMSAPSTAPTKASSSPTPKVGQTVSPPTTMRGLLERIEADPNVSDKRAGQIRSAVNKLCALIGTSPESAPVDPAFFSTRVAKLTPGLAGVTKRTLRNQKSLLQAAFKYANTISLPRRFNAELTGSYLDLYQSIEPMDVRFRLSRFMRFVQREGIPLATVAEDAFDRFRVALTESGDSYAQRTDRNARQAWNQCVRAIEGWPGHMVAVTSNTDHYVLPLDAFPRSFRDDLAAYIDGRRSDYVSDPLAMLSTEELFANAESEQRRARPMGQKSAELTAYQLRQFASILVITGALPLETITKLQVLTAPALVKQGLQWLIDRARTHENSQIFGIAMKISLVARHWVGADEGTCKQLTMWAYKCRPKHAGLPQSARRSIIPLRDLDTVKRFLELPHAEFARLRKKKDLTRFDASVAAAALWIAIAQRVPARISNLVGIDVERHLVRAGTPKAPRCSLIFEASEVKNGKTIEAPLPIGIVKLIAEYIERYRPLLCDGPTTALFPGQNGRPKRANTMSQTVQQLLRRRLGFTVNPHSFRHVAAMLYLSINKGDYASVQLILGHKKLDTTLKYYVELKAEEAFRALDALLEAYVSGEAKI